MRKDRISHLKLANIRVIRGQNLLTSLLHTFLLTICFLTLSCSRFDQTAANNAAPTESPEVTKLKAAIPKIERFFEPMGKPEAYDWLGANNEPGQTFDEYIGSETTRPTAERQTIYVLPLGKFTAQQLSVIDTTAEYLSYFYDLPVKQLPARPLNVPPKETRYNDYLRTRQVRTGHILDEILKPIVPNDAAALIALTNDDLYPDASMSYVFGQARFNDRVGIWSLRRLEYKTDPATSLRRTLKIAAHETGHMFSMRHCTKYECVMSGTNHIAETDRRPIDACPECTAKICLISDVSPAERYERLAAFCRKHGLTAEALEFDRKAAAVRL